MSEIINQTMNEYRHKVSELKNKFIRSVKNCPSQSSIDLLQEMRILHGKAILEDYLLKKEISGRNNVNEDDYLKLSINASLLHIIHGNIRFCESASYYTSSQGKKLSQKKLNKINQLISESMGSQMETESEGSQNPPLPPRNPDKPQARFRNQGDLVELTLSIVDPTTSMKQTITTTPVATEDIENLKSSEVDELFKIHSEIRQGQKGGQSLDVTKPTIINYWASWCGYSNRFLDTWKSFEHGAPSLFPILQVLDLDVGNDKQLIELAEKVGVKGYPTAVLFINKKIIPFRGERNLENLNKFVKDNLSKEGYLQ